MHTTYTVCKPKEAVVENSRGSQLHLSGNGRCGSSGYSAKYCTYTLMGSATDLILDYSLAQRTETGTSVAMEKEKLRRCLDKLMVQDADISTVITDRHTGVASLMRTDYPPYSTSI